MEKTINTLPAMHTDHRHWIGENETWRRDIRRWQEDYETVLMALDEFRQIVQQHGDALKGHVDSINTHEAALELHERTMVKFENEGKDQRLNEAAVKTHEQQAIRHLDQRQTHERIKREHYALVAQLKMLKAAAAIQD